MNTTQRWESSLLSAGLKSPGRDVYLELEQLYSEPHRKYHNLQHVVECLKHLDSFPIGDAKSASIELAIWFHDAIYFPLRPGNEMASADLARQRLSSLGADRALIESVYSLVMATTHSGEPPQDTAHALMIDIDLAILGASRNSFQSYEAAIRTEYRLVPRPIYRQKRKAILETFLRRDSIYYTRPFIQNRERQARSNLLWSVSNL